MKTHRRNFLKAAGLALGAVGIGLAISVRAAEAIHYEALKGDALAAVLKPLPPKEPPEALALLEVIEGFGVEYVAHEPLVLDPVAAAIDENGVMYVAEDADYPFREKTGKPPLGRIRVLRDKDGDGFYEDSHVFAEGFLWPAGVAIWKGGVFVSAPPDIWYLKDTNGDFKADIKIKIFTGFGMNGSQYIVNNLQWGLDHKISAAVAGNGGSVARADGKGKLVSVARKDFQFDPATQEFEGISGGRQFGNTFDDWGNRFLCSQDTPVYQVVFPARYLQRNPFLSPPESAPALVPGGAPIFRTSPIEAWRAVRSSRRLLAQRGSPGQSGVSHNVLDGVAGSTVYRGGAFPQSFYGNLFSGDAQNNLVHRRSLVPDGVLFKSERLDKGTEFLRSQDNWFRPVNFVNAPDGTLYVLDLAREILEAVHIPMDVVSHLDLTSGRDRGRIFRVFPKGFKRPPQPKLGGATTVELVGFLESPHSWWRETAHRLIYERQDKSAEKLLRKLLQHSERPQARLHALWSLEGIHKLSDADILTALGNAFAGIRENALRLAETRLNGSRRIAERCVALAADPDARVRFQAAFTLGELKSPLAVKGLALLAHKDAADQHIRTAVLSSSFECAAPLTVALLEDASFCESAAGIQVLEELTRTVGGRQKEIVSVLSTALQNKSSAIQQAVIIGLSEGARIPGGQLQVPGSSLAPAAAQQFSEVIARAIETVKNKDSDPEQIRTSLRLLENAPLDKAQPAVTELLDRLPPAHVQVAAIQTLSRLNVPGVEELLFACWRVVSPEARRAILASLLSKRERTDALLTALETSRIAPGQLDASSRSALRRHTDAAVQKRAEALWGNDNAGSRTDIVRHYRPALDLKGDTKAGQEVFQRLCASCHRLKGVGNELGANLALAESRSPDELLTHILDPNRQVDPAFVQYNIETRDGESYSGIIAADEASGVTLKGVNFKKTIPRQQIKTMVSSGLSLMPEGLEQGLNFQSVADLLAFLMDAKYDLGTSGHSDAEDAPVRGLP